MWPKTELRLSHGGCLPYDDFTEELQVFYPQHWYEDAGVLCGQIEVESLCLHFSIDCPHLSFPKIFISFDLQMKPCCLYKLKDFHPAHLSCTYEWEVSSADLCAGGSSELCVDLEQTW